MTGFTLAFTRAVTEQATALDTGCAVPRPSPHHAADITRRNTWQKRTPDEVLAMVKAEGVEIVDFRFCDLPGLMQHFSVPASQLDRGHVRRRPRLRRLVDPRVPGDPGVGHAPDPGPRHRRRRPVPRSTRPSTSTASCATRSPARPTPATPATSPRRPRPTWLDRHRRHRLLRPRARVLHLRRRPLRHRPALVLLLRRLGRGQSGTPAATRARTSGYKPRYKEGYFPVPPMDHFQDLRSEMILHAGAAGHRDRGAPPRGGHRRPGRDRHAVRHAAGAWPTS